jgi:hypothetical protein
MSFPTRLPDPTITPRATLKPIQMRGLGYPADPKLR